MAWLDHDQSICDFWQNFTKNISWLLIYVFCSKVIWCWCKYCIMNVPFISAIKVIVLLIFPLQFCWYWNKCWMPARKDTHTRIQIISANIGNLFFENSTAIYIIISSSNPEIWSQLGYIEDWCVTQVTDSGLVWKDRSTTYSNNSYIILLSHMRCHRLRNVMPLVLFVHWLSPAFLNTWIPQS